MEPDTTTLELYQFEQCPFCQKARTTLSDLGLTYVAHNPRKNEERMDELMELGGEDQVPFLVVRGADGDIVETMYESDDIVEWLDEQFGD